MRGFGLPVDHDHALAERGAWASTPHRRQRQHHHQTIITASPAQHVIGSTTATTTSLAPVYLSEKP